MTAPDLTDAERAEVARFDSCGWCVPDDCPGYICGGPHVDVLDTASGDLWTVPVEQRTVVLTGELAHITRTPWPNLVTVGVIPSGRRITMKLDELEAERPGAICHLRGCGCSGEAHP